MAVMFSLFSHLGLFKSRLDVEVEMTMASSNVEQPTAKAKAKPRPKRKTRALSNGPDPASAGGAEGEVPIPVPDQGPEPKPKRGKMDEETKRRLEQLKLQTDMVHMQQKWVSRIKVLNQEVTASVSSSMEFAHLKQLLSLTYSFHDVHGWNLESLGLGDHE